MWEHPECVDPRDFLPELTDQYIQHWAEELQSSTGKLRTYKLNFSPENYLELASQTMLLFHADTPALFSVVVSSLDVLPPHAGIYD